MALAAAPLAVAAKVPATPLRQSAAAVAAASGPCLGAHPGASLPHGATRAAPLQLSGVTAAAALMVEAVALTIMGRHHPTWPAAEEVQVVVGVGVVVEVQCQA